MRVGRVGMIVAAMVVIVLSAEACSTGDGGNFVTRTPSSTAAVPTTSRTVAPVPTTTTVAAAGSVTLRVIAFTLPDSRAGGTGLRLLVRSSSERLTVRRRGGGGAVSACPVALAIASPRDGDCADLPAGGGVELPFLGGVELRATGAQAAIEEVAVSYVPASRTTTVVTPSRPTGACQATACEVTFAMVPGGAGTFVLTGQSGGGRPRLVLTAVGAGVSNRTLATVEGGGSLSIRASLEAGSEARLLHHEQGPGPIAPVTAEILWP